MSGKFSTTSSSLFNCNNPGNIPEWMENLNINIQEKEIHDLGIQAKGSFAEEQTVYREELNGAPRYLEASFNDTRLITDSKIQLAKFLTGKYYKAEHKIIGNSVNMDVKLDGIPAKFNFGYNFNDGKITASNTFFVNINEETAEYPYSKAGLEECLTDIKNNKVKIANKSVKVSGVNKAFIINKEEIVRRYNGHLREATERINELINTGDIIGVGSNSFASLFDVEYLFPTMQKEAGEAPLPAFEFAPNTEHVASKQFRSAQNLAIDASKVLSELFADFKIIDSFRDNNELLLKADVLNNNGTNKIGAFCFGIENEKVASLKFVEVNDERMTVEQLLDKLNISSKVLDFYLSKNPTTAKRIYRGIVLTEKEINRKFTGVVSKNIVNDIIANWVDRGLINPINSTTYTTTLSFGDLLNNIKVKTLTAQEQEQLSLYQKKFGSGLEFDRQNYQDTGNRDLTEVEGSDQLRLANLNNYVSKYFKNFVISDFVNIDKKSYQDREHDWREHKALFGEKIEQITLPDHYKANLYFVDEKSGVKRKISIGTRFLGNEICNLVEAEVNGENTFIEKLANAFENSPLLSAYLQDNKNNLRVNSVILSERKLKETLAAFTSINEINNIINDWYGKKLIANIGNGLYTSKHSLEELLNMTNATLLSENDKREIAAIKKYFGEGLEINRDNVEDTGVREPDNYITDDTMLIKANEFLSKYFKDFKGISSNVGQEILNYSVQLFDNESGLNTIVNISFDFNGNKIVKASMNLNGEQVSLDNVKKVFAMNEALSKYLELNPGKRTNAPMVMTSKQLNTKLKLITKASLDEIEDVIENWNKTNKISKIASNVFASKYTFEQLISMSNIKPLTDEEFKNKITHSKRERKMVMASHIHSNDTRLLMENWSPERMALHAKAELNKIFKDFDLLDVNVTSNNYTVTARVVNPKNGLRQKLDFTFEMIDQKPAHLSFVSNKEKSVAVNNIEELALNDAALNTFIQHNIVNQRNYKNLISKTSLKNKLSSVIAIDQFDSLVEMMFNDGILQPINSVTYASNHSVSEIVTYLSKFGKTDLNIAKENQLKASRDEHLIKNSEGYIKENDTRVLENKEKTLSPKMLKSRKEITNIANKAHNQKLITANKLNQVLNLLDNAMAENDIELAWRELKKYL